MKLDYIAYAILAVGVFTAYMALVNIFRQDKLRNRLKTTASEYLVNDRAPIAASFCQAILSLMRIDTTQQKEVSLLMAQAGFASPYAVVYYLFFKRVLQPMVLLCGVAMFLKVMVVPPPSLPLKIAQLMFAAMLTGGGLFGVNLFITNLRKHRQQALLKAFPEALDLLLVCIESGLGLDAALARVCGELRESQPMITGELDRARIELTVMSDRTQALQNLAERTDITPIKSLVSALIQTEKFGTSLLDTLRVLSDDIRTARLMAAENKAARIPVLITIPLIFCILPAFIMVVLGPPIVRVVEQGGIFGTAYSHK